MTHPHAVMALAREIAGKQWPSSHDFAEREAAELAAALAIVQTTEMAAKLAEKAWPDGSQHSAGHIATALRTFTHLTTKGDGE